MAHPLRLTLLDLVERRGTLTSAEASTATGESTGSCSFHLRQLAKYGFIEPAEGRDGRERRWKRATTGERIPASRDPGLNRAAELSKVIVDRFASEAADWLERYPDLPPEWREASLLDEELLYLTPSELRTLSRTVTKLFARYHARTATPSSRPRGSRAVRVAALLFALADDAEVLEKQVPSSRSNRRGAVDR